MQERDPQTEVATDQPSAEKNLFLKQLTKQIGPYGETLSVVAVTCVLLILLFTRLGWYAVILSVGFLAVAWFAFRAAVEHAEWLKQDEKRVADEKAATRYQVTEARLLTLRAVGVPDDIIIVMMKSLGLAAPPGEGQLAPLVSVVPLAPLAPKCEKHFRKWLIHDLGLGEVRVREYEEKILTYTVYDVRAGEHAAPVVAPQAFSAAPPLANREAMSQAL